MKHTSRFQLPLCDNRSASLCSFSVAPSQDTGDPSWWSHCQWPWRHLVELTAATTAQQDCSSSCQSSCLSQKAAVNCMEAAATGAAQQGQLGLLGLKINRSFHGSHGLIQKFPLGNETAFLCPASSKLGLMRQLLLTVVTGILNGHCWQLPEWKENVALIVIEITRTERHPGMSCGKYTNSIEAASDLNQFLWPKSENCAHVPGDLETP
ncbi:uncharacterized protein LOC120506056 isoform X2 [Passer montanus]|uniref:uncharacterized protein LOC120506056 isoform X2 n=1 Tax=Passer montanus TaxID=9160 RepID=UPI001960A03B|nr:uncharacterized protein LOC120506056 isoform X2 [Passer montanus]